MELVEGTELRKWLKSPRPWREVRDKFLATRRLELCRAELRTDRAAPRTLER